MLCRYVYISSVWPSDNLDNRSGCAKTYDSKPWIYVWDKLYNNSNPVHPDSPDGPRQMEGWQKWSHGAPMDTVVGKPHQDYSHQSHTGRCGPSTGLDCYGKADGPCCSSYGWCGFSPAHCGAGCQNDFGICDSFSSGKPPHSISTSEKGSKASLSIDVVPSAKPTPSVHSAQPTTSVHSAQPTPSIRKHYVTSPDGHCGGKDGYTCEGFSGGPCCSSSGWCGTSFGHCAPLQGCQPAFGKCEILRPTNGVQHNKTNSKIPIPHIGIPVRPTASKPTESPVHVSKPQTSHKSQATKEPQSDSDQSSVHGCPHDLEGGFEFPHLIVPVTKSHPDKAIGNQFSGTINDEHCTIYNFDISPKQAGKKCSLIWLFPEKGDPEDGSFYFSSRLNSSSIMEFWHLSEPATEKTTW